MPWRLITPLRTWQPAIVPTLRHLEHLAHLGLAEHDFLLVRAQHALERGAHVGHRLVDDLVQLDLDALALGRRARLVVRAHVEADDDRAGRLREQDVALGDRADRRAG